jgi:hypothetical protein
LTVVAIRRAGATVLVAAALLGGCGHTGRPSPLSALPNLKEFAPIESVSPFMQPVRPGEKLMLRLFAWNLGRNDIVLDRIELVGAKGVVMHDAWTLDSARLVVESEWDASRDGWHRDPDSRDFAGSVVHPQSDLHKYALLTTNVSITGAPGDSTAKRPAVMVEGFRVTAHVGNRKFVTVLPLGFRGCFFQELTANPLCPKPTPKGVLDNLGLPSGDRPLG